MNQKKCPKCGENNPAEAVMCWACYTPLSGGGAAAGPAGLGAGGAKPAGAPAGADGGASGEKKALPLPMPALAGIGVVLLLAIGLGVKTMMGGGGDGEEPTDTEGGPPAPPGKGMAPPPTTNPGGGAPGPLPAIAPGTPGDAGKPPGPPFVTVIAPNPQVSTGNMAIMPQQPSGNKQEAAGLAQIARRMFANTKRWQVIYIYVFNDQQSASEFSAYQVKRRNAALSPADYAQLRAVWGGVLVCYEFRGGREKYYYPSSDPDNWWRKLRAV